MYNKKRNNKGFSLVELIVVIAVMAVLVGVLAPAYLRYVEKSRAQKDVSAVAEVVEAIKIAAAEEAVSSELTSAVTITIDSDGTIAVPAEADDLKDEVEASVGTELKFTSDAMKTTAGGVDIVISRNSDYGLVIEVKPENDVANTEDIYKSLTGLSEGTADAPAGGEEGGEES